MKIMTYNLRFAGETPPNSWNERKDYVAQLINEQSPDIMGTQEGLHNQLYELASHLPDYEWIGLGREGGSKGEHMAIFYKKDRFEIIEYDHFWLSDTPQTINSDTWGNSCVRMATWIRFKNKITNEEFYLLNTHFDHVSTNGRTKSAEQLVKVNETLDQSIPFIITGDFNSGEDSVPYQILVNDGPFTDVWSVANQKVNEHLGSFTDFKDETGGTDRIDWILFRGDVNVLSCETVNTRYNNQFPSDHYPIISEIKFTK